MNLYAESSAVLAWLMGELQMKTVRPLLRKAQLIFASSLTILECERVLVRALSTRLISESETEQRRALLHQAAAHWYHLQVTHEIIERAKQPFPVEPIRTLDALHLSTSLLLHSAVPNVAMLSLDGQIRKNARAFGMKVVPVTL